MGDTEGASASGKVTDSATQPHVLIPQTPAEAESSDDDDWFNKSLDDFDIPAVKDDAWSGEDDAEEDEGAQDGQKLGQQKSSTVQASKRKSDRVNESQQKSKTTAKAEGESREDRKVSPRAAAQGAAAAHPANDSDESQSAGDTDSANASDSKVDVLQKAGVLLVFSPQKETNRFKLFLRRRPSTPAEKEQSANGGGEEQTSCLPKPGSSPAREDKEGDEKTSTEDRDNGEGEDSAERTEEILIFRKKRRKSDGNMDQQESKMVDETDQKQHGEENAKLEQKEPVGKKEEVKTKSTEGGGGGGDNDDDEEEKYAAAKAASHDEELTEEWFQKQLQELPTPFKLRQVHDLSEARLRSKLFMVIGEKKSSHESDDKDADDDVKTNKTADDNDGIDFTSVPQIVQLLKTSQGDYDVVVKCEMHDSTKTEDGNGHGERRGVRFCGRSSLGKNFMVMLKWLLGKRQEAETEARHFVEVYPFSLGSVANLFYILWRKGERKEAAEILSHFTALKKRRPDIYEGVMCEDQRDLGWMYTELGPEFIPDALAVYEEVVPKKPHWYSVKWNWALNLRRLTNLRHTWLQPLKDIVTPLLKAAEILLELMQDCREESPEDRTAAAAELGDILRACEFDEKLRNTVGRRAEDFGLNAAKCFDIVMQEEDTGGSNLVRAGKYFRYSGQLQKSEKALKKAVAVQNSPKAHHQLALTLKKLAMEERRRAFQNFKTLPHGKRPQVRQVGPRRGMSRQSLGVISRSRLFAGDSNMKDLQRAMKSVVYQTFSREDKYVNETMYHLNKALMLSHGENCVASYDLGLMYKALGEYSEALEQFLQIAEILMEAADVVNAFEQAGLVTLEKCSLEENETRARAFQEDGKSMLNMAILIQSRIVQQFRGTDESGPVWRTCYTLGQYLQLQQEVEGVLEEDSLVEIWLLRLLRVYADTLPVLTSLQQFTQHDENPRGLMDKLQKYLRDQRYEDVILFSHLLRLTQQGGEMKIDDSSLKALLLGARLKLMKEVKAGFLGSSFNTHMAKRFFRWAFEDVYISVKDKYQRASSTKRAFSASPNREFRQDFNKEDAATMSPTETLANTARTESRQETGSPELSASTQEAKTRDSSYGATAKHDTSGERHGEPFTDSEEHSSTRDWSKDLIVTLTSSSQQQEGIAVTQKNKQQQKDSAVTETMNLRQKHSIVTQTGHSQPSWAEDVEEEGQRSLGYHVLLLHDPGDSEAASFAQVLQPVLQKTCGLQTHLPEFGSTDFMQKATLEAMDDAHQLLFVIGHKETSPELESYIQHASAKFPETSSSMTGKETAASCRVISTLTLGDASALPKLLQNRPTLASTAISDLALPGFGHTVKWVDSVCKLFCFLTGLDVPF